MAILADLEKEQISLILSSLFGGLVNNQENREGFVFIERTTFSNKPSLQELELSYDGSMEYYKFKLGKSFKKIPSDDLDYALDDYLSKNSSPVVLDEIQDTPAFKIDRSNSIYDKYIKNRHSFNNLTWEQQLRADLPNCIGMGSISRPGYDPKTGLIFVYLGLHEDHLCGRTYYYIYKYLNGKIEFVESMPVMIS